MDVALFHPGTQHSWQTARALQDLGRMAWFATSLFYRPDRLPYSLGRYVPGKIGHALRAEMRKFAVPALDPALVRAMGWEEWVERIAARGGLRSVAARIDRLGNRRFAARVAARAAGEDVALWGYNGSSMAAFCDPRLAGRPKILDRTIGDWRAWNAMVPALRERWPDWITAADAEMDAGQIARDDAEYAAADAILCGSPIVAQSIADHSPVEGAQQRCHVLPYCHDDDLFARGDEPDPVDRNRPVRFLFVGHLSLRKGLPELLHALARLPRSDARLTLVGELAVPEARLAPFADRIDYRGRIARQAMPALMREHHALVLPSRFEGSAITLLEALASGLALIQTRAAGMGATGDTGIVLDNFASESLAEAMAALVRDRARLDAMRIAAWRGAARHGFAAYRANVARLLDALAI